MFTPVDSAVGAILIHFATTQFLVEAGKTVGLSSIIYNSIFRPSTYPVSIVGGLILSTLVTKIWYPEFLPTTVLSINRHWVTIAGLLVGFGTKLGSGCTSGHMLCGLSLMRVRSLVATMVFSATAMLVVNRFNLGPTCSTSGCTSIERVDSTGKLIATLVAGYIISKIQLDENPSIQKIVAGLKTGFLFGMGLFISGMADPGKPVGFLSLFTPKKFDPSLAMIILFAIIPNVFRWHRIIQQNPKPLYEESFDLPTSTDITPKFLLGNAIFGIGWALGGVCPGPGLITSILSLRSFTWLVMFLIGRWVGGWFV